MRQLGLKPSDTELEDLMNEIDTDRSGTISFEGITAIGPALCNVYLVIFENVPIVSPPFIRVIGISLN